jgi:hypothetical protein
MAGKNKKRMRMRKGIRLKAEKRRRHRQYIRRQAIMG